MKVFPYSLKLVFVVSLFILQVSLSSTLSLHKHREMEGKWELLVEKLGELVELKDPQESMSNFLLEKLHQLLQVFLSFWALLVDKFNQTLTPERRSLIDDFVAEKLDQLFHIFHNIWALLVESFNQVLPPEKRSHEMVEIMRQWAPVGLTTVVVVLLCAYCCRSKKPGHGTGKMMKAPGAKGAVMARKSFERNPKDYFRNLHAQKKIRRSLCK